MHIQAPQIHNIARRAKRAGKLIVLGGASVSGAPELYPEFDYLHIGEIGDGTDRLITSLDQSVAPPQAQIRFETNERLPLCDFPLPACDLIRLDHYLIGSLQFSSGCPYRCEFCDIPALYGRQPRLKTHEQITAELDEMLKQPGHPSVVYFVDDNFIGNRKAARELLPHLIDWQRRHDYQLQFACEATLNLAKQPEILSLMRRAQFLTVFVGIETPEADALKAMRKEHNSVLPMMEAIKTLNSYGLEVTSGIILGLDTDTADTESRLKEFIDLSEIPILTINLLQALPRTPLWDRLKRADRLIVNDKGLESNVRFLRSHDEVVATWRRCVAYAYDPERLFARFAYQIDATYAHRMDVPVRGKLTIRNLREAVVLGFNVLLWIGLLSNYRRSFWRAALRALKRGQVDAALGMGLVAYHLILFSRDALRGDQNASFYSTRSRALTPSIGPQLEDATTYAQLLYFLGNGYRVIAHDRRGHGRSGQVSEGHDMDHYAADAAALFEHLDLKNAVHVGHSTGGGEATHYVAQHGQRQGRVAKLVLISAVPPIVVKTPANPGGLPMEAANRAQFYLDFASGPFYGFNRPGVKPIPGVIQNWWRQAMMGSAKAQYDGIKAFSETDFTADLKTIEVPTLVLHGDVPIADSALLSIKLLKKGTLKVHEKFPHGMCTTHADVVNPDLLAFIAGQAHRIHSTAA